MTRPGIRDVAQQHGLTVRGRAMACPRPEHEDRHPSVSIYDRGGTERWRCHRCGVGGDVYDLLGAVTGRDGRDVYRQLAGPGNGTAAPRLANGAPRPARTWPTVAAAAGGPRPPARRERGRDVVLHRPRGHPRGCRRAGRPGRRQDVPPAAQRGRRLCRR